MSPNDPLLRVENLKKYFSIQSGLWGRPTQRVFAVDDVSFDLQAGETLGLVGESGCGKSTLGRTLLRLYEPTAGRVLFDGVDLASLTARELRARRKDMQIIFQDPYSSLNPRFTIGQTLAEPFSIHRTVPAREIADRVAGLLTEVGLPPDVADRYPHEFSGGQRQRIGIARAIALRPKLVVADEPVSALDVSIQSQILNLLQDLRTRLNLAFVLVAHDLAVIEHMSDRVAVMYLGRIVEYAPARDLYRQPRHPYTQALISAIPEPDLDKKNKPRKVLAGDVPSPMAPPSGCHFHPRCPLATEVCRTERPQLKVCGALSKAEPPSAVGKSHWVSCHHVS